ncbi:hypothetical protein THAOC_22213, partial [Thalassiosira oceanica]
MDGASLPLATLPEAGEADDSLRNRNRGLSVRGHDTPHDNDTAISVC